MQKELKIKLLKTPYILEDAERNYSYTAGTCRLPPIDMAIITGFLRHRGYNIDQDDLNIRMHLDNYHAARPHEKINTSIFTSTTTVFNYIDNNPEPILENEIEKLLKKTSIDGSFSFFLLSAYEYCQGISPILFLLCIGKYLKKQFPHIPVIAGGGRITKFIDKDLFIRLRNANCLNYLIHGAGEQSLDIFFQCHLQGRRLDTVPGIMSFENNVFINNPFLEATCPERIDYRGLPIDYYRFHPSRRMFLSILKHHDPILILPYMFSSGCPNNCAFCFANKQTKFVTKTIPEAVNELAELSRTHNTNYFYFLDNTFNWKPNFIHEFQECLEAKGLSIIYSISIESTKLTEESLRALYKTGCRSLVFGMETASPRLLRYAQKNISIERLELLLKQADAMGFWTAINILCGLPTETEEDIQHTVSFLQNNEKYIDEIFWNNFKLIRNSLFEKYPERYGITNIRKRTISIDDYKQDYRSSFDTRIHETAFDEENGLPWEEKKKQISHSSECIRHAITKIGIPLYERTHIVFYLFSLNLTKPQIRAIYQRISFWTNILAYLRNPAFLIDELKRMTHHSYACVRLKEIHIKLWANQIFSRK